MKRIKTGFILGAVIISVLLMNQTCFAAYSGNGLTWDGKATTLRQIADKTGYDLVDTNGNYKPMYTFAAEALWNDGLFAGSDGSFDLDMPLTREQGTVMILRILGKDGEALSQNLPCKFTDVAAWAAPYVAYAEKNGLTSGISAAEFGGNNVMTANQYCTYALRALGYKDGEDFVWSSAIDKAKEVGLIGDTCHVQYTHSNLFLRDNAAMISYNALYNNIMKTGGKLISAINAPGKPAGSMPIAVRGGAKSEQPAANAGTPKPADNSGAKVSFSNASAVKVNKLNGTVDYISASIRLEFIVGASGKTSFKIVQSITPVSENYKQEITTIKSFSSSSKINNSAYNGFTVLTDKLYCVNAGGVNSNYDIKVYIDGTDELVGSYRVELPYGGYFYFK